MKTRDIHEMYFSTNAKWMKESKENDQWCRMLEVVSTVENLHQSVRKISSHIQSHFLPYSVKKDEKRGSSLIGIPIRKGESAMNEPRLELIDEGDHWIKMDISISFMLDFIISLFVQNPHVDILDVYESIHGEEATDRKEERKEWTSRIIAMGSKVAIGAMGVAPLRDATNPTPLKMELEHISSRSLRKCVDWLRKLAARLPYAHARRDAVAEIADIVRLTASNPLKDDGWWMSSIQSACITCSLKLCGGEIWRCDVEEIKHAGYRGEDGASIDWQEKSNFSVSKELKSDICSHIFERILLPFGKDFLPSMLLLRCICVALVDQMAWWAAEGDPAQHPVLVELPPSGSIQGPFPSVFQAIEGNGIEKDHLQQMLSILQIALLDKEIEIEMVDADADADRIERFASEEDAILTSIGFLTILGLNYSIAGKDTEQEMMNTKLCDAIASSIGMKNDI
jgi:hypothetical protein